MSSSTRKDSMGNMLRVRSDGMYLKLASEKRRRKILSFRNGSVTSFVKSSNLFQNGSLVGFNYGGLQLLESKFPKLKSIIVVIGKQAYKVQMDALMQNGQFLHFKGQGFELQMFYPVADMEKIKRGGPPRKAVGTIDSNYGT